MASGPLAIIGSISTAYGLAQKLGLTQAAGEAITTLVARYVPDPDKRAAAALELQRFIHDEKMQAAQAAADLLRAQAENANRLNMADAQSGLVRRDWRSFIGWTLAVGVLYALVLQPLGTWLMTFVSAWFDINFPPPPELNWTQIVALLATLLTGAGLDVVTNRTSAK